MRRYMLARPLDHGGLVKDMLFSPDLPAEEFARCRLRMPACCPVTCARREQRVPLVRDPKLVPLPPGTTS